MNPRKKYLLSEVPELVRELTPEHRGVFGIMTPQHMVEHLIWVTKSSVKDFDMGDQELNDKQLGFMKFVKKGARLRHRPSDAELKPVRMPDLQSAIDELALAVGRLYQKNEEHIFYNPMMGRLTFDEMERFHYMHFKYHLQHQFGLGLY